MPQLDFPNSPTPGQTYAAPNGVTYTWDTSIGTGVWTAAVTTSFTISSAGSITGTPEAGATLTYVQGTYTGGTAPVTESWQWKKASDNSVLQTGGLNFVVPSSLIGNQVYITYTVVDATPTTLTQDTADFPVPPATITAPALTVTNPGSISGTAAAGSTLTYTAGTFVGGLAPVTTTWEWRKESDNSVLQTGGPTYVIAGGLVGDRVYVRFIANDSAAQTAFDDTPGYPAAPSVITAAIFPNTTFSPSAGPNASPASVNTATLKGTATATWADGAVSLTSTGDLQFQVNGGGYGQGPTAAANGGTVDLIWDPTAVAAAADGAVLTGTLTDGTYINSYSFTVNKKPNAYSFTNTTGIATTTLESSNVITPDGFNVPITFSAANGTPNTLTTLAASVNGGGFSAFPQTVNPGNTIQVQGTTGGTISTAYTVNLTLGSGPNANSTWSVTTTTGAPEIQQPSITGPANGATNINPVTNAPSGVTLTSSAYTPLNGAGTHASSDWEVYENFYPLTSTNSITAVTQNAFGSFASVTTGLGGVTYKSAAWDSEAKVMGLAYFLTSATPKIARSLDNGTTWSVVKSGNTNSGWVSQSLKINNHGVWVAAQAYGTSSSSIAWVSQDNGVGWFAGNTQASGAGNSLYYTSFGGAGETTWNVGSGSNSVRLTSTDDGVTWTTTSTAVGGVASATIYRAAGTVWIAGLTTGVIKRSTDNATYTTVYTPPTAKVINGIADSGSVFVTVGDTGTIRRSTDGGLTWTTATSGTTVNLECVSYGAGYFMAVGASGTVLTSPDGNTWTPLTSGVTTQLDTCVYNPVSNEWWIFGASSVSRKVTGPTTTLTIAGCQTDGFAIGDIVKSLPAAAGPATITAVDNTNVTVGPASALWAAGQQITRDTASYTQIVPPPANPNATDLVSLLIAQASLSPSTKYWARVRYTSTDPVTSNYSSWSSFTTAAIFAPAIGAAYQGGYFAGQIKVLAGQDGGGLPAVDTVYNLVIAPKVSGSLQGAFGGSANTTTTYKSANTTDTPTTTSQNAVYGKPATVAFADAAHPAFNWAVNTATGPNAGTFDATNVTGTGIGGFNDWYIPAANELNVLYYYLKPTTTANVTTSGLNPNAVAPQPNTDWTSTSPAQTTVANFQSAGTEAFATVSYVLSSTENSASVGQRFGLIFTNGTEAAANKTTTSYARAVRRVFANLA